MRLRGLTLLLIAGVGLFGCSGSAQSQQSSANWTTGFWFWQGSALDVAAAPAELDVVFFQAGTINNETYVRARPWAVYGHLPEKLPAAREYWAVFRFERQGVPELAAAPPLGERVSEILNAARRRRLNLVGVQLDIDSPTSSLTRYAGFLREVRKGLPPGTQLSVTALLDWFRDGTEIAEVIGEVDEFVPQFYDVSDPAQYARKGAVAAKVDAAQWAPKFNQFGKRFRIGISTFGRARLVRNPDPAAVPAIVGLYRDLIPLDIASNPAFQLNATRNEANELVLNYRANVRTRIEYNHFEPGDTVQFILATPESVRAAVDAAKQMGEVSAGVVFFRWPSSNETLSMEPKEVLIAAGLFPETEREPTYLRLVDGSCAAVHCVDVYIVSPNPFSPQPVRYRIRSSRELEYFLPEERMPVRMTRSDELELSLPPYSGRKRMYLGRAVTAERAEFRMEEER